jgi:hypothetical protein
MTYTQHPLSAAFPAMSADDFQALKDSIENIGVQNPVTLLDGMVIDGWHRYTAAMELGMPCPTVELGDVDPRDFAWGQNGPRRHMTSAQLASATAAVYAWYPANGDAQKAGGGALSSPPTLPVKSNAELASIAGVSVRSIQQAKSVHTNAAPEVIAAVKSGEIGLPKAAAIAKLPKEEQAAAIEKPVAKPAKAPAPQAPENDHKLDDAANTIRELSDENEQLRDRLAVEQMDASEEAKSEAAATIAEMRDRIKALEAELDAVKSSRDGFQRENAELKKQIVMNQKQIKKLGG